jgi:WD40 repeat protein
LVTVSEGTAEVAHEALLHEWPRLRTWLEDDAEGRKLHRRVTESSRVWDEGGRDSADLYRGARLTAAWEWAAPHEADLNDLERAFLRASHAASEREAIRARRTNRRLLGLLAGVAVLLAASLVIGKLALDQRNRATGALTLADAGRLASRSLVEKDPVLALLMAREAVKIHDSAETRSALFTALERTPAITNRIYAPGTPSPTAGGTQWIAISPDGKTLAIGGKGPAIEFFDAVRYAYVGSLEVRSGTERATFSPDGQTLVVATSNDEIVSVDVATRTERGHVPAGGSVDVIAFSPDGTRLVTAENLRRREYLVPRNPLTLQSSGPKRLMPGVQDHSHLPRFPFVSMAFAPDSRSLITTSAQGPTVLWNARGLTKARLFKIEGGGVAVSPDGGVAAIIVNDDTHLEGDVWFLNLHTYEVRKGSGGHHGRFRTQYEATGLAFTPNGGSVITAGNDSRLLVWDVASASVRERLTTATQLPLRGPAISTNGTTAFTTDQTGDVAVWDLSGRRRLDRAFTAGSGAIGTPAGDWAFFATSSDGRRIAVISFPPDGNRGTIELIDTSDLRVVRRIRYGQSTPLGLAFSPDSTRLAVSSVTFTGDETQDQSYVRLWDVDSGKPITSDLPGIPTGVWLWSLAFSPDGRALAGGGPVYQTKNASLDAASGRVYLWSTAAPGQLTGSFRTRVGGPVTGPLGFTPDGSRLIVSTGFDNGAFLSWDTKARAIVRTTPSVDGGVYAADISNDGRTLVTGATDGIVHLWDIASGSPIGTPLTGLKPQAVTVDMSPDGRTVVGADALGEVLLWDVPTGTVIAGPLPGPNSHGVAAAFASHGRSVVVVSVTGSAWRWDVNASDWETRACQVAGRSLTQQEWRELLPDRPYHATCGS